MSYYGNGIGYKFNENASGFLKQLTVMQFHFMYEPIKFLLFIKLWFAEMKT